jgi:hypothetical protein
VGNANFIWYIVYWAVNGEEATVGLVNMSGPKVPSFADLAMYIPGYVTGRLLYCIPERVSDVRED